MPVDSVRVKELQETDILVSDFVVAHAAGIATVEVFAPAADISPRGLLATTMYIGGEPADLAALVARHAFEVFEKTRSEPPEPALADFAEAASLLSGES